MMFYPGTAEIKPQARGVVLIVGSDRNPVGSVLCPLVTAIAAGNGVIVKPSDIAPKCARVINTLISSFLDNKLYHCFQGTKSAPEKLAVFPFDMICMTGEESFAKKILLVASSNLTQIGRAHV